MIKVDEQTHARLAQLAAESGTTIGGYVARLVGAQRTRDEWAAIARETEKHLREQYGFVATSEERVQAEAWLTREPQRQSRQPRRARRGSA
jgi:hypothetical protein